MKVRHVDFYPDEFIAAIPGMTVEQIGAYWVVCALMYSSGGPIPAYDLRIIAVGGISKRRWPGLLAELVDMGKLDLIEGFIRQNRVENELKKAASRAESSVKNGKQGGRPKAQGSENNELKKGSGLKTETLTTNYQPPTTNQEESPDGDPPIAPPGSSPEQPSQRQDLNALFSEWWRHVPRKTSRGQAEKAFRAALKIASFGELVSGVQRWAAEAQCQDPKFVKHPATWLNAKGWLDEPAPQGALDVPRTQPARQLTGFASAFLDR